jgi:hypothetical protein
MTERRRSSDGLERRVSTSDVAGSSPAVGSTLDPLPPEKLLAIWTACEELLSSPAALETSNDFDKVDLGMLCGAQTIIGAMIDPDYEPFKIAKAEAPMRRLEYALSKFSSS